MQSKESYRVLYLLFAAFITNSSSLPGDEHLSSTVEECRRSFHQSALIVLPGRLQGENAKFIIDTGASMTFVDSSWASQHSLPSPLRTETIGTNTAGIDATMIDGIEISLNGFPEFKGGAAVIDLEPIKEASGVVFAGVLGMTYLRSFAIRMENGTPQLQNAAPKPIIGSDIWPMKKDRLGCFQLAVHFPVIGSRDAVIDTGFNGCMTVTQHQADLMIRAGNASVLDTIETIDASGLHKKTLLTIRDIEILGCRHFNVPATIGIDCRVGMALLRHMDFTLDFPNERVFGIAESNQPKDSFPLDASGLQIIRKADSYVIRRIEDKSAATKTDVAVGDQLIAVDNKPIADLSRWSVTELLSNAGTTVNLGLIRDGQTHNVPLALSRSFQYPPEWKPRSTAADDFFNSLEGETK